MTRVFAISLACLLALAVVAVAADFTAKTPVGFKTICTGCHEPSRTDVVKDSAYWDKVVEDMSMKYYTHFGSKVAVETKTEIARYLSAKSVFSSTCSKCHGADRPMGAVKDEAGWKATVARMSSNHEKKFGAAIPAAEQERIVLYLTVKDAAAK